MIIATVSQVLEGDGQAIGSCQQIIQEVQAELGAFHAAVSQLYGDAAARIAAEFWLEEFTSSYAGLLPCCRSITVAAASHLAHSLGFARMDRHVLLPGASDTPSVCSTAKEVAIASNA